MHVGCADAKRHRLTGPNGPFRRPRQTEVTAARETRSRPQTARCAESHGMDDVHIVMDGARLGHVASRVNCIVAARAVLSVITFTTDGTPLSAARVRAGSRSSIFSTNSP